MGLSGAVSGASLYLAFRHVDGVRRSSGRSRLRHLGYFLVRLGLPIVVLLVAEAVYHSPAISPTWRSWLYTAGLLLIAVGYVLLALIREERG